MHAVDDGLTPSQQPQAPPPAGMPGAICKESSQIMKLLQVDSSILGTQSASRELTRAITAQWLQRHPDTEVQILDLAQDAPSHLNLDSLGFRLPPADGSLTEAQRRENAISEALVSQFLAADVVVIGAPMYNFAVPSQLKAWIDRIAQAGRTFRYTASGPEGLAGGKTVLVASTRGGMYSGSEGGRAMEHQESYLQVVLGFLGITDVRFVRAEGLAMGDAARSQAMAAAAVAATALTGEAANQPRLVRVA